MMPHDDDVDIPTRPQGQDQLWGAQIAAPEVLALVILWSAEEPQRVGEVALLPAAGGGRYVLGRAPDFVSEQSEPQEGGPRLRTPSEQYVHFSRQRPSNGRDVGVPIAHSYRLRGQSISRRQLELVVSEAGLSLTNVGRSAVLVNGRAVRAQQLVTPGSTIHIENQLLLYCTQRPLYMLPLRSYPVSRMNAFGLPDADGMVGESPAMWRLREELAVLGHTDFHTLILGESGSGKELAAQAIHIMSPRGQNPLIADNIASMPPELAAAILFGNRKNFPQYGMEERVGLIGLAHGSTLFLDEVGDTPERIQPMLLRVTEKGGGYCRLGEEHKRQQSDFRLLGATNREELLRHELRRRFQRVVRIPRLQERREDIPLLLNFLFQEQKRHLTEHIDQHFVVDGQLKLLPQLVEALVHRDYRTHVSEVAFCLGQLLTHGMLPEPAPSRGPATGGDFAPAPPRVAPAARATRERPTGAPASPRPAPDKAQQALVACQGNVSEAAKRLGISRQQLNRMIAEHDLRVERVRGHHFAPAADPDKPVD